METIYVDHVAGTPLHPKAFEAMIPFFKECYGNPSSIHASGDCAREALEEARKKVAKLIGSQDE